MAFQLVPELRPALPRSERSPARAVTTGTFTQPWVVENYATREQWDAEFDAMQSAGIDLWIFQWTADSGRHTTVYPTQMEGWRQSTPAGVDMIEMGLAAAQRHNMRVFLGLAANDEWWQKEGSDRAWLEQEARAMVSVGEELYSRYYARYPETFAGWYINWEMDNAAGYNFDGAQQDNITWALKEVSSRLKALNPTLPVSTAPFFNTRLGAGPRRWQYFWYDVLREADIDIIMLQDGVGVGHAAVEDLPEWFGAVCDAARLAGKACWSDLENFATTGDDSGPFVPAPPERVAAQHRTAAPFVDRIVTFSFISYMSPANGIDGGYLEAYQKYRESIP